MKIFNYFQIEIYIRTYIITKKIIYISFTSFPLFLILCCLSFKKRSIIILDNDYCCYISQIFILIFIFISFKSHITHITKMKIHNLILISFAICAVIFLSEKTFCKQTIKNQKTSTDQSNKNFFISLRDKSILISKPKHMSSNMYSMIARFGKKRFPI